MTATKPVKHSESKKSTRQDITTITIPLVGTIEASEWSSMYGGTGRSDKGTVSEGIQADR